MQCTVRMAQSAVFEWVTIQGTTYTRYFFLAQFSCERDFQFLKNFVLAHFLNDTNFLLAHFPSQWLDENRVTHKVCESFHFHPIIDSENVPKLNLAHSKNVPKQNFWEIENLSHKTTVPKRNTPCIGCLKKRNHGYNTLAAWFITDC